MGIFLRWLGAFVLLAATFNPTEWNYVKWAEANMASQLPLVVFAGLILAVGFIVYGIATLRSIGRFGFFFLLAVFLAGIWVLLDWGVIALTNFAINTWLVIFALSLVLAIGLVWARLYRRLSGQVTDDDET